MNVRAYKKEDYGQVETIFLEICGDKIPEDLGGYALVLEEDDGTISAFCWALVHPDSSVAYVDYLFVSPKFQSSGRGFLISSRMMLDLHGMGISNVVGSVTDTGPISIAKVYMSMGFNVGAGFVIRGRPEMILPKLQKHIEERAS